MPYESKLKMMVNVKCPYFRSERPKQVSCWESDDSQSTVVRRFDTEEAKTEYFIHCCSKYPNKCAFAMGCDRMYED